MLLTWGEIWVVTCRKFQYDLGQRDRGLVYEFDINKKNTNPRLGGRLCDSYLRLALLRTYGCFTWVALVTHHVSRDLQLQICKYSLHLH